MCFLRRVLLYLFLFNVPSIQDSRVFRGNVLSLTTSNVTMQICASKCLHFHLVQHNDFVQRFRTESIKCNDYKVLSTNRHVFISRNKKLIGNFSNIVLEKIYLKSCYNHTWVIKLMSDLEPRKWTFEIGCFAPQCEELGCDNNKCEDFSLASGEDFDFAEIYNYVVDVILKLYKYINPIILISFGIVISVFLVFIHLKKLHSRNETFVHSVV